MIEFIYVLAGILAVIFGFYLGRGTYNQSVEEVEARMGKGKPRRARARRLSRPGRRKLDEAHLCVAVS